MTAVVAPARRAPAPSRRRAAPTAAPLRVAPPRARAARAARSGRFGTVMVFMIVFALVSAVVFHVVLAQHQLELDHLNTQIAVEQRAYEQNRLIAAELSSPDRIIQEAERLGLVRPPSPPETLEVPGAPLPAANNDATATTLKEWTQAKPSLGRQQP